MKSFFMSALLLSLMISTSFVLTATELTIGQKKTVDSSENSVEHLIVLPSTMGNNYLKILTTPESNVNPGMLYIDSLSVVAENMGDNLYYIPKEQLVEGEFGFTVKCIDNCKYDIIAEWTEEKNLILGTDITLTGTKEANETATFIFDTKNVKAMIYFYTYNINDVKSLEMTYVLQGETNEVSATKNENGYAFIAEPFTEGKIIINVKGLDKTKKITIGARDINSNAGGRVYSNEFVFLQKGTHEKQCISTISPLLTGKTLVLNLNYLSTFVSFEFTQNEMIYYSALQYAKYIYIEQCESFCFELLHQSEAANETTVINYQLIYSEDMEKYRNVISPIFNDFIYQRYLPLNAIQNYKYPISIDGNFYPNAHINDIFGRAVLYAYNCESSYPCSLTKEQFDTAKANGKIIMANELNDDYTITKDISTLIFIVQCEQTSGKGCEYNIDLGMIQKKQSMLEHYITLISEYDYFINSKIREFRCLVDDPENKDYTKIQFTVSSFSGSCYIDFVNNDNYTLKAVRGKIIYEFPSPLKKEYKMEVKGGEIGKSCIVSYEYDFSNQVELRSGRQNIEYISLNDKKKSYSLIRREVTSDPYAITIESPDCLLTVDYDNQSYSGISYKQFTITDSKISQFNFNITVDSYKVQVKEDNYCTLYITGGSNKDGIVVNEGVLTELTLSYKLPNYDYVLPNVENAPYLYVQIDSEYTKGVELVTKINNFSHTYTLNKSTYVNMGADYTNNCNDETCTVYLTFSKLSTEDEEVKIAFNYEFYSGYQPMYIQKDKVHSFATHTEGVTFFYTDIKYNEEGEVVIDFKKGGGIFYAKLVGKDEIERTTNWNDKLLLPSAESYDYKFTEQMESKFRYTADDTQSCQNGCELYISVEDYDDKKDAGTYPLSMEYSIYITTGEKPIEVEFDKYTLGYLDTQDNYKYYQVTIPIDIDRVMLTFNAKIGYLYVNDGDTKPTKESHKFVIDSEQNSIEIKASDLSNSATLYNVKLTIGVVNHNPTPEEFAYYKFKISPQPKENFKVSFLSSEIPEKCETIEENNFSCYYVAYMNDYDLITRYFVYAYVNDNPSYHLNMFSKIVNYNEMKLVSELSVSDFDNTEFETQKNYQEYVKTESEKYYLLVKVQTDIPQNITLLLSGHNRLKTANIKNDFPKLLFIPKASSMNLMIVFDEELFKANLDINNVINELTLHLSRAEEFTFKNGFELNFNLERKPIDYVTLENKDTNNDSIAIVNLYRITELFNEINEGDNTIFTNGSPFPNMVFFPIEKYKMQTNINYNVEIVEDMNSEIEFETKAYIVTDEWVKKYKYQRETTIVGDDLPIQKLDNGSYFVTFTDEKMNHPEYNILITFEQLSNDTSNYTISVIKYSAYYGKNYVALPEGTFRGYTFESVDDVKIIRIEKKSPTHNFYKLEFGIEPQETGKEIDYDSTIEKYRDFPIYKQELDFDVDEYRPGYKIFSLKYEANDAFLITVKPKPEEGIEFKKIKMLVKVLSSETKEGFPTYKYNKIISAKGEGNEVTLTFNTAFTSSETLSYSKYIAKVCDTSKISLDNLYTSYYQNDTIADCQHVEVEVENSATPVSYKFTLTKQFNLYGIALIGHFIIKNTTEEVLLPYTPYSLNGTDFEKLPSTNFNYKSVIGNEKTTFILTKNKTTASYFKIEFGYEAVYKKENILQFAVEQTSHLPSYQNDSSIIVACGFDQGKYTYIVNQPDESKSDIMISFWKEGDEGKVNFIIKYISQDNNLFPRVTFQEDITAVISENKKVNVEFYEVLSDPSIVKEAHYHLFIFSAKSFDGEDSLRTIDTIYTDMSAIQRETFPSLLNGEKREVSYQIDPSLYSDELYAALVFSFDRADSDIDERVAFNYIKITDKKFEVKQPYKYHTLKVTKDNTMTYRLLRGKTTDKLYQIEIATEPLEQSSYLIKVTPQKYAEDITTAPQLNIKSVSKKQGKLIYIVEQPDEFEEDILVTFSKTDKEAETRFLMRYETAKTEEQFEKFEFNEDVTYTIEQSTLKVKFNEVLSSKTDIVSSKYYISVYDTSKYTVEGTYNTVYTASSYLKQTEIEALNDGSLREATIDLGSDITKNNLYITVVFEFAKATTVRKLAYKSKLIENKNFNQLPSAIYNELIVKGTEYNTYRLHIEKDTDHYFQVEFETVPLPKEDMEVSVVFEKYKETPTYTTEVELNITKSRAYGRDVYLLESKDGSDILVSLKKTSESDVRVYVKYITEDTLSELPDFKMEDDSISTSLNGTTVKVGFKNHLDASFSVAGQSFVISVYRLKDYYSAETIHTIFIDNNGAVKTVTITAPETSATFDLDKEPDDVLYVNVVSSFFLENGRRFQMSYNPARLTKNYVSKAPYVYHSLKIKESQATYRLRRGKLSDKLYQIEIASEPLNKTSDIIKLKAQLYNDTIETAKDLTIKSTSKKQGKITYIIEQPDETEEDILVTFSKTDKEEEISFLMRYETAEIESQFEKITFNEVVQYTVTDTKLNVKFNEVLNSSTDIKESKYYISVYDASKYTVEGTYNTIYTLTSFVKQIQVSAYNDGRSREESIDLGSDITKSNLHITVVFEFAKATTERKVAYISTLIEQRKFTALPSATYNEFNVTGTEYNTYRLHREKSTDHYFQVEFETVPLPKEDMEVSVVFEKYKETPSYTTEADLNLTKSRAYGRDVYLLESKDDADILISLKKSSTDNVLVYVKYITEDNQGELPDFKMEDDTISTSIKEKTVTVGFKNHLDASTEAIQSFVISVYRLKDYYSAETIHTIFIDNNGAVKTVTTAETSVTFELDEEPDDVLYVNVVSVFVLANMRPFQMSYTPAKLPIIEKPKAKEYIEMIFSSSEKFHTYRLARTNNNNIYVIEVAKSIELLKQNVTVQFSYEDDSTSPKYTNDTEHFEAPKELQNEYGKETLQLTYKGSKQYILIHFYTEKPTSSNELRLLDQAETQKVAFKYKVVSQESEIKVYNDIPALSASIFLGTLTVSFKEIFDTANTEISKAHYTISIYNKTEYSDKNVLYSIENDALAINSTTIEGEQKQQKLEATLPMKDINCDLLVGVIATYTTTDGETGKIAYKVVDASSNTYILVIIIVLAVLIVLAIGGFFIIKVMGKRRMKNDLLALGGGIGEKINFNDDSKEINMVEQGSDA